MQNIPVLSLPTLFFSHGGVIHSVLAPYPCLGSLRQVENAVLLVHVVSEPVQPTGRFGADPAAAWASLRVTSRRKCSAKC